MTFQGFRYYHYDPSLVAAIIFIILFLLTTAFHSYQLLRTRTWYFIPFLIGGFRMCLNPSLYLAIQTATKVLTPLAIVEWIGYAGRAVSSQQSPNWTLPPYLIQQLFLLLAPVFFAASIYMELARIILLVNGETHAFIRPKWLTMTFVTGDILSFALQAMGGGLMSTGSHGNSSSTIQIGQDIIVGGLFVQIIFFGCFLLIAVLFQIRIRKAPTPESVSDLIPWRKHLIALYVASVLILIRSVFRVAEFIQGNNGFILGHEWFLYLFDSVLMLGVMLIFNVVHPSEVKALLRGGRMSRGGLKLYDMNPQRHEMGN